MAVQNLDRWGEDVQSHGQTPRFTAKAPNLAAGRVTARPPRDCAASEALQITRGVILRYSLPDEVDLDKERTANLLRRGFAALTQNLERFQGGISDSGSEEQALRINNSRIPAEFSQASLDLLRPFWVSGEYRSKQ